MIMSIFKANLYLSYLTYVTGSEKKKVPNCRFNNYVLAVVLFAYIILLVLLFLLYIIIVMKCNLCLAIMESMLYQLRSIHYAIS